MKLTNKILGIIFILVVIITISIFLIFFNNTSSNNNCKNSADCSYDQSCQNGSCENCTKESDCPANQTCSNSKCVDIGASGPAIESQQDNTVQLVNQTSENPLHIYMECLPGKSTSAIQAWVKIDGQGNIDPPVNYSPSGTQPANDVGAGWWCVATLKPNEWMLLKIPDFVDGVAWSARPLKYFNGKPCTGGGGDCGMPILIESGKNMVGDMSAVDGVNFLNKYEMTAKDGITVIDFNNNPCKAVGLNPKGCRNPSVNGIFKPGINPCLNNNDGQHKGCWSDPSSGYYCWCNKPCPAGTCNLSGDSLKWCDTIHTGQCANSESHWDDNGIGYAECGPKNKFTTYCYSHDDANSSPYFSAPYKMKITYRDLDT